jgi:hypothetical protein
MQQRSTHRTLDKVLRSQIFKSLTKLVFNNFRTFELMISTSLIQVTE